jgi:hypothetical protein
MKIFLKKDLNSLHKDGYLIKKNILSIKDCKYLKKYFLNLSKVRQKNGEEIIYDDGSERINNFFLENFKLTKYLINPYLVKILKLMINEDYVLRAATAMNLQDLENKRTKDGTGWHTDWAYNYNNEKFGYGGSYHVIFAVDNFYKDNGATHIIPGSHKIKKKPIRNKIYKYKTLVMQKGSIAIFDSSIWHRSGIPSKKSRWGIWCVFTHWWVKPYFRFNEMFSKSIKKKIR